ncbi:ABC transporter ATP-binding protein [Rhodococcus sp. P1Y]|uniref:ABC transporter ATP-binding protein n=1 Tax=Rhodococcus sp. P1Y TaxID=1302308 RepID=UPI000EB1FB12|nr:ATP-binding cassette domain-containing protein [Rhodococcus sp. P1Y]AYJ49498.1 ATP-binding cassette domain-containing protein [Rhodococcus sp. P1Y]
MTTESPAVLRADNVDLVRNGRYLLRDATLRVDEGQHWVLLGANGAGKSTLLSLLGAFVHPTHGTVHVLGHRLGRVDLRELRTHIGHVDPRLRVEPSLTLFESVLTGLTNTPDIIPRWAASEDEAAHARVLIDSMGVRNRSESPWYTLSQGERGRALIARALLANPALLLLDEPATGLDLAAREQLLTAMDALRADHPALASILVTHHLEEIPASTTHAVLIRDGKITAHGVVEEVITTKNISECFDHPIVIDRRNGRWAATAG